VNLVSVRLASRSASLARHFAHWLDSASERKFLAVVVWTPFDSRPLTWPAPQIAMNGLCVEIWIFFMSAPFLKFREFVVACLMRILSGSPDMSNN
jgi:hypothetical protein